MSFLECGAACGNFIMAKIGAAFFFTQTANMGRLCKGANTKQSATRSQLVDAREGRVVENWGRPNGLARRAVLFCG